MPSSPAASALWMGIGPAPSRSYSFSAIVPPLSPPPGRGRDRADDGREGSSGGEGDVNAVARRRDGYFFFLPFLHLLFFLSLAAALLFFLLFFLHFFFGGAALAFSGPAMLRAQPPLRVPLPPGQESSM